MPTTFTQRCARHAPFQRAISMTAGGACRLAIARRVPVRVEDGDIITPRIAYRGVPAGALPVRTTAATSPIRAFDRSAGPIASFWRNAEHCGSYASLNHPSREGRGAIPSEGGGSVPCRPRARQPGMRWQAFALAGPLSLCSCAACMAWCHRNGCPGATTLSVGRLVGGAHRFLCSVPRRALFFHVRRRNEQGATCAAPRWPGRRRPDGYETG